MNIRASLEDLKLKFRSVMYSVPTAIESLQLKKGAGSGQGSEDYGTINLRNMESLERDNKLIRLLLPRLERISVDSYWAHRASGVRGALVKILEQMEAGDAVDPLSLRTNIRIGFEILQEAAEEYT